MNRVRTNGNVDSMFICSFEGCHKGYFTETSFREHQKLRKHVNADYEQQRQRIAAQRQQQQKLFAQQMMAFAAAAAASAGSAPPPSASSR